MKATKEMSGKSSLWDPPDHFQVESYTDTVLLVPSVNILQSSSNQPLTRAYSAADDHFESHYQRTLTYYGVNTNQSFKT